MNVHEVRDNADYIGNTSFQMEVTSLRQSIERAMDKCEAEIDAIYDSGMQNSRSGKTRLAMLEDMLSCYGLLYNEDITSEDELDEVTWMFNKGSLRSKDEILEFCEVLGRKTPRIKNRKEVYAIDSEYRISSIMRLLPFITATTLGGLPFLLKSTTIDSGCIFCVVITIFAFVPCWLLFHGIELFLNTRLEYTIYKERTKRGEKYEPNKRLLLDAGIYAAALGIAVKKSKKNKL